LRKAIGALTGALAIASAASAANNVRISQVYGGGGNTSAPYNADFVELYNNSATAVDISGYTLTYASATGTYGGGQFSFPAGTKIGANSYVLVQMSAAGAVGAALRADFYTATAIAMSATEGNVALLTAAQSGTTNTCASLTATLVDKVGYGTTANCYEGTSFAPAPSNTTSVIRKANGATDTDVNSADFYAATPAPRNSLTRSSRLATAGSTPSADGWTEAVTGTASGSVGSSDASTVSWALTATAGSANGITETRSVSAGAGKTIFIDFDGNSAAAPATGCSTGIEFRSGANVALALKLENGTSFWKVVDSTGTVTSTLAPTTGAIAISVEVRGSGGYVLTANAYTRTGTLASSSTAIDSVRVFNTGIATAVNFNDVAVADSVVSITAAPGTTAIPDNNATGTSASIVVSAAQAPTTTKVRDIRASMTVSHTFAGDVSLSVVSPDGTVGYLVNRIVSTNDNSNYSGTYLFADPYQGNLFSVVSAAADANIATGSYYPTNNSAGTASDLTGVFFNKTVNGTWKLTAADGGAQDTGTFTTGTLEIWLGTDTDGDGTLDEFDGCPSNGSYTSPVTWYQDSDGDTYGNSAVSQTACSQPTGYVSNSTDCNDSNAAIKPGAPELCANSTVDDNCNGNSTEIDAAASDKVNYYVDADGDTYTTAVSAKYCPGTTNSGYRSYLSSPVDCNDASSAVNPGAAEICDGVDNNCSGATDEGFTDSDGDGVANCVDLGYSASLTGGSIPDNSAAGLAMSFTVPSSGFFTAGISNVRVTLTGLTHGVVGDLTCTLTSPDGTVANIFVRPGGAGDTNDFSGTYVFDDSYTANLHTTATGSTTNTALAAGNYFASNSGGGKVTLNTVFGAKKGGGTWTLKIFDSAASNTGTLTSAKVELTAVPDADGDGTSDALDGCVQNPALTAPVTYYRDADGDGYGIAGTTQSLCQTSAPAGYVTIGTDCNDALATSYPGATEFCDGVDQDCDGVADNGFSDTDGDGIGDCVDSSQSISRSVTSNSIVPDNNATGLSITFAVPAGSNGAGLSAVTVGFTVTAAHPNVGQLTATLTAPNGAVATVFAAPGGSADNSNLAVGTWNFADSASTTFYAHALAVLNADLTPGTYAASNSAGTKVVLNTAFADVKVGGNWVLKIVDAATGGTATIGTGTLTIAPLLDRDGDGTGDATDGCPDNASLTAAVAYYVDADGDGYGSTTTASLCAVSAPAGYSSVNTDCNDSNAAIKPTATEVCDLVDNNCDGTIDEGVKTTFYRDADGDGYGTAGTTSAACTAPTGYVASSTDCNDANSAIKPGATELCDGIDQDCDGAYDNGFPDADGDTIGDCVDTTGWTGILAGGDIPDNGFQFVRTNGAPYASLVSYASLTNLRTNASATTVATVSPTIAVTDGLFTDGKYFYKVTASAAGVTGSYNDTIIRYASLANLASNTGGVSSTMSGYTMYFDDEIIADGATGRFFRTTRYNPTSTVTIGMYAYNSYADLVSNNYFYASGFVDTAVAFDCKFWAVDGKFYRTNVTGTTGSTTVTGINVYNSSSDLYNNVVASTVSVTASYAGSMRFLSVSSTASADTGTLERTFTVPAGQITAGISSIMVGLDVAHGYVGDLTVELVAPNGTTATVLSRPGKGTGTSATTGATYGQYLNGYPGNLFGLYYFQDSYTGSLWTAASSVATTANVAAGNYFASSTVNAGATDGTKVLLNSAFSGLTPAQVVGTWTLRIKDSVNGDVGTLGRGRIELYEVPDADSDGTADATDGCPNNAALTAPVTYYRDADGDGYGVSTTSQSLCQTSAPVGYVSNFSDCNDANAAIKPGAPELCADSTVDNNCDGTATGVDANASDKVTFYRDADSDGYGTSGTTSLACTVPTGYVSNSTDCNDSNAAIKPGAAELCADVGVDNNCNGSTSDVDANAADKSTFFRDADGDGYGTSGTTSLACTVPTGYVSNSTDCNDSNAAIKPGAPELCADSTVDNNCDGTATGVDTNASDKVTFYADADGDTYTLATGAKFCSGTTNTGYRATVSSPVDCDDTKATVYPSAPELCADATVDNNCNGNATEVDANASDKVTFYTDADGDTYTLATGAKFCSGTTNTGYRATVSSPVDCDDTKAAVYPGALELCADATVDNNCNGNATEVDANASDKVTFYTDADGDTYTLATGAKFCSGTTNTGYRATVSSPVDCDDTKATVYPSAPELCADSTVDNNCNGNATEVDANASDKGSYYADADADGYTLATAVKYCAASVPAGYVSSASKQADCDDANAGIKPGSPELCADATVDNNCNGNATEVDAAAADKVDFYTDADGDTYTLATGAKFCPGTTNSGYRAAVSSPIDCDDARAAVHALISVYLDGDHDGYGSSTPASICELAATVGYSANNTDCDDSAASVHPGATEVCNEIDDNCVAGIDEGVKITFYADTDNDGAGDANSTTQACSAPFGYVANAGDACPENSALVAQATYYADVDNDGAGDSASTQRSCSSTPPAGYVAASGDSCPNDGTKTVPGACGCGTAETDGDGDGTPNCIDACPNDRSKTAPGACGCGSPDTDADSNGTPDCDEIVPAVSMAIVGSNHGPFGVGEIFTVRVSHTTPGRVISQARLSIAFDAASVMPMSVSPVDGSPFSNEISQSIDLQAGTIRYIVGSTYGSGSAAADADIEFIVLPNAANCGTAANLVSFTTIAGNATTYLSVGGDVISSTRTALPATRADGTKPVLTGVPANASISCDAGSLVGAYVANPNVTAADACAGDTDVEIAITYPDLTTADAWPETGIFPIGTTTVVFSSEDDLGNAVSDTRTIEVLNQQLLDVTVTLDGSFSGNSTRRIRVAVGSTVQLVDVQMTGTTGTASGVVLPVAAGYSCATVKDIAHSLSKSGELVDAGAKYTLAVTLKQGDSNNDNAVDILDFGLFVSVRGTAALSNAVSNFNGDLMVDNYDFSWISLNFFQVGETCTGFSTQQPLSRVRVRDLGQYGLERIACADFNGDGWIDTKDVAYYVQHSGNVPAAAGTADGER